MPQKILIVEDEQDLALLMENRLQAQGYEVIKAFDGLEGLELARKEMPDLILLDVMIPKKDGFQICRMLKFDRAYQSIPIILLTARGRASDQKIGEDVRADAYINKPFEASIVLQKIKELLAKKPV